MRTLPAILLSLSALFGAQVTAQADETPPKTIIETQEIRPLPGKLNQIPVFNSNSPEVVKNEGILLSTFPKQRKAFPEAHLNYPLTGRFDIFTHHIANSINEKEIRTLYEGLLIRNNTDRTVHVKILQQASYLSQPDAPFVPLPDYVDNPDGKVFAGPGDRITNELLRSNGSMPQEIALAPNETTVLASWSIPVKNLTPYLNGRSTLLKLKSDGPVSLANLATFAKVDNNSQDIAPGLDDWLRVLNSGDLVKPREKAATDVKVRPIVFGRVAGVAQGDTWTCIAPKQPIPEVGQSISYVLSTVDGGTWGTDQIQSAPLLVRYPDTAFQAHGNYGIKYDLTFPLTNSTSKPQTVTLTFQTPLKSDKKEAQLSFFEPPPNKIFFRGTLRLTYKDDNGQEQTKYVHVVSRRGQKGFPLVSLNMKPKSTRTVRVEYLYPPDSTPPQVLTIKTLPSQTASAQ